MEGYSNIEARELKLLFEEEDRSLEACDDLVLGLTFVPE
jgi:hypothetical protein